MALRVWLPLNGTLENKGIGDLIYVNGTIQYKTSGKIASTSLDVKSRINFKCALLANLLTFSVAFWAIAQNSDTLTTNWLDFLGFTDVSSAGNTGTFRWETTYSSTNGIHWHDNATNALVSGSHNHITVKEKWVHCCVVFNLLTGKIYSYDNGILTLTHNHAGGRFNSTGSFYLGETNNIEGMIQDVRFYDHALSAAEVKEISQGLVLHYKLDDITNGIKDSSGYGHNGIISGNVSIASNSGRYSNCIYIPSGNTDYITTNDIIGNFSSGITMNIWFKSSCTTPGNSYHEIFNIATATQNFEFAIYKTGYFRGGMVINGTRYVDNTNNTDIVNGNWHMITMTYDGTTLRRYVDGIDKKDTTISGTLTSSSCKFLFGHYGTNTSYYAKEAYLSDARIYTTALSADDIKSLYNTSMKIDNLLNIHTFEFIEGNPSIKLTKQGQLKILRMEEEFYSKIRFDNTLYIEPDGSTWIHIFHHNNPANARFNNGNTDWSEGKFLDADRWYDIEKYLNHTYLYEFLYKLKTTSNATETKYRWIQSVNPLIATWTDVKPGTCTYNTSSGYTNSSYGGIYLMKSANLHMCIANGNSGNWYGGLGACNAYNGGIPGYPNTTVTSGYIDLYIRVYIDAKLIKNIGINANTLIER